MTELGIGKPALSVDVQDMVRPGAVVLTAAEVAAVVELANAARAVAVDLFGTPAEEQFPYRRLREALRKFEVNQGGDR